jgi:hypothetical protein
MLDGHVSSDIFVTFNTLVVYTTTVFLMFQQEQTCLMLHVN